MKNKSSETNELKQTSADNMQVAGLLIGGGAVWSLYLLIKKNRSIFSWILPVGLVLAGLSLFMKERQEKVKLTGDQIIAQLDELDPIAKARVVKYVADQEIARISR
jgi:hypothetical protein